MEKGKNGQQILARSYPIVLDEEWRSHEAEMRQSGLPFQLLIALRQVARRDTHGHQFIMQEPCQDNVCISEG